MLKIYLEGTRKRELVQKDVRFLGFESFLGEKNIKRVLRSFPRDSNTWFVGVRWLLFCLYPNSGNVYSSYCRNLQIFPEVDLDYRDVHVEKFTGRALFQEKHTSNFETSREVNFWIFFSDSILTIIKPRNRTMTTMKARKDGCTELQEAVMPGVKMVMRCYNTWSEPPA
jgi:hypothetical protein